MKWKAGVNLKCRECEIAFLTRDGFDDEWCPMCGGVDTIVPDKAPQPTAIGLTDDAPRSGEARSEAAGDGQAPLPDGPAEWRVIVDRKLSEARRGIANLTQLNLFPSDLCRLRAREAVLVELIEEVDRSETEGPAGSDRLSNT